MPDQTRESELTTLHRMGPSAVLSRSGCGRATTRPGPGHGSPELFARHVDGVDYLKVSCRENRLGAATASVPGGLQPRDRNRLSPVSLVRPVRRPCRRRGRARLLLSNARAAVWRWRRDAWSSSKEAVGG